MEKGTKARKNEANEDAQTKAKEKLWFDKKRSDFGPISSKDKMTLDMLRVVYGAVKEVPKRAKENDRKAANEAGTQLTYGEIDPRGVMMMAKNLSFKDADVLLDIGSGRGRVAVQAFDQYSFSRVIGVEVARERFDLCENAVDCYVKYHKTHNRFAVERLREMPHEYGIPKKDFVIVEATRPVSSVSSEEVSKCTSNSKSTLEFYRSDIGALRELVADAKPTVVLMDMAFPSMPESLASVLNTLPFGTRILTYENLAKKWPESVEFPFSSVDGDRFLTSWETEVGHYFFKWVKKRVSNRKRALCEEDAKELADFGIAPHTEVSSPQQPRKKVATAILQQEA
mmetsp:Transcript_37972/g.73572  ORF Transcript_37972/g.73572 Transcript_37972/m.73572 type:complete len:341 (-) Transcript_37972:365-1387(-)